MKFNSARFSYFLDVVRENRNANRGVRGRRPGARRPPLKREPRGFSLHFWHDYCVDYMDHAIVGSDVSGYDFRTVNHYAVHTVHLYLRTLD